MLALPVSASQPRFRFSDLNKRFKMTDGLGSLFFLTISPVLTTQFFSVRDVLSLPHGVFMIHCWIYHWDASSTALPFSRRFCESRVREMRSPPTVELAHIAPCTPLVHGHIQREPRARQEHIRRSQTCQAKSSRVAWLIEMRLSSARGRAARRLAPKAGRVR